MDLVPLFQQYGYIVEIRMQVDKGYAFCKLVSIHEIYMVLHYLIPILVNVQANYRYFYCFSSFFYYCYILFFFYRLDTHENAATAILTLNGTIIHGRALRVSKTSAWLFSYQKKEEKLM